MGRSISDRLSYRNHYMCSGEATSTKYDIKKCSNLLFKNVGNSLRGVEGHSHFQKPLKLSGKAASKHISYQETCNLF